MENALNNVLNYELTDFTKCKCLVIIVSYAQTYIIY
jgi:hypothetical protein